MNRLLMEFLKTPQSIGAIAPSSRGLAEAMLQPVNMPNRKTVVELGPGTGPMTEVIAEKLNGQHHYVGIELNPNLIKVLRGKFPKLDFACDSVENIKSILAARHITTIDAVICSLPWASLPISVQEKTFAALRQLCGKGSVFVSFAYLQGLPLPGGRAFRARLKKEFSNVRTSPIVWRNLPPALVYICEK